MTTQTTTPLWLDLKISYIDENLDKVLTYIHHNSTKDAFYDITIDLLTKRIDALIEEFHTQPLLQDENIAQDSEKMKFTARLLGLYLLSVNNTSENYRSAFLLFIYALAVIEPKNMSIDFVGNALKFVLGALPAKSVLEWEDIEKFNPNIVAHKLNITLKTYNGFAQSDSFEMKGAVLLSSKKLQLAATNTKNITHSFVTSLSIVNDIIQVITPKSDKLKQSKASDIESVKEFTQQFLADQSKVVHKLKKYVKGDELTVRLVGKKNNSLHVVSVSKEYEQVMGVVDFSQNFFFYNDQDFYKAMRVGDEFEAVWLGDGRFDIKTIFMKYFEEYLYSPNIVLAAKAVGNFGQMVGWGTESGFGVYTSKNDDIDVGDCAEIKITQRKVDENGVPTGWVYGELVQMIDTPVDYNAVKFDVISNGFIYEKEDGEQPDAILSEGLIKMIYRILTFTQQQCVVNPSERYRMICICQMFAKLLDQEQDLNYLVFLGEYLENLVRFAKSEYEDIKVPSFESEYNSVGVARREKIISILQAYGNKSHAEMLDEIIDEETDGLLVKLAILVQSCNRLDEVINRSMQNVIKREIIANLACETEGETDLEEENGIYLGIENSRQEFKTSFFHAPQNAREQRQCINVFKGVCAFLNTTDGGTLYLGVNDLGYVQGIEEDIKYLQKITTGNYKGIDGYMRYITDQAKQYFDIDVVANIKTHPMFDNQVIALEVTPYEFGIVELEDTAYLRVNGESVAIGDSAIQRISSRKKLSTAKKNTSVESLSKAIRAQQCVILRNYQSSNSGKSSDRKVEVFDFTENGTSIWCYDLDKKAVRLFNISRIGYVETLSKKWENEACHVRGKVDIFNMTGDKPINICLRLNMRAKNLLLEEFPLSKGFIVNEGNNSWLLTTEVYSLAGVARFYIGLANSIDIIEAPELKEYIKEYCATYLKM